MPRGRHRHSQPLHRLLPPVTVAASAAVLALAALVIGDPVLLRVLVFAAAASAAAGAVLLRSWDRSAGKQVADLKTARVRDEWRADERIAELEVDLEDSRDLRGKLENKLRGKRAELARLRTEHADLLRRYATAESERARALEEGRVLAGKAAGSAPAVPADALGPTVYLRAAVALKDLSRNAARQQAVATVQEARRRDMAEADEQHGRHAASADQAATAGVLERPAGNPALPVRQPKALPAVAAAVLPYAKPHKQASRAQGGFDFFGTAKNAKGQPQELPPGADVVVVEADLDDLDDAVGDEALAARAESESESDAEAGAEVIDLTAHDETEQFDLSELRAQSS
ncbi:hypothetical protein ACFWVC_09945 [Streptomyces sp. NPDC058691]|uniref:hypothetical protein n=1 Tax=Streptomyces sp. NPDC058691 TaxID=3346601 RepID=UPI003666318F